MPHAVRFVGRPMRFAMPRGWRRCGRLKRGKSPRKTHSHLLTAQLKLLAPPSREPNMPETAMTSPSPDIVLTASQAQTVFINVGMLMVLAFLLGFFLGERAERRLHDE